VKAIEIIPATRRVGFVEIGEAVVLEELQRIIGQEDIVAAELAPGVTLWVDGQGLLRPDPQLWRLNSRKDIVLAGSAVITGHLAHSGEWADLQVDVALVAQDVRWLPELRFAGQRRRIEMVPTETGFVAVSQHEPVFAPLHEAEPPEPEEGPKRPLEFWTLYQREAEDPQTEELGAFYAKKLRIEPGENAKEVEHLDGDSEEELRKEIGLDEEAGDRRFPRGPADDPRIIATWIPS
jgi:hypothetical protein